VNQGTDSISLYRDQDGQFARVATLATGHLPAQVVAGDLSGDGWDDLVVRNAGEGRVKRTTFQAFHLTMIEGKSGAAAAASLQIPVAHVFVNKHRVQKLIQDEVRRLRKRP
jgi:hypothetical protein